MKNLRQGSLHLNVFNPCLKFHIYILNIKRDHLESTLISNSVSSRINFDIIRKRKKIPFI